MSTLTAAGRLEALKRSLEAALRTEHPHIAGLSGEFRAQHEQHLRGLTVGLQIAIDAIDSELRIIAAGQAAADLVMAGAA